MVDDDDDDDYDDDPISFGMETMWYLQPFRIYISLWTTVSPGTPALFEHRAPRIKNGNGKTPNEMVIFLEKMTFFKGGHSPPESASSSWFHGLWADLLS